MASSSYQTDGGFYDAVMFDSGAPNDDSPFTDSPAASARSPPGRRAAKPLPPIYNKEVADQDEADEVGSLDSYEEMNEVPGLAEEWERQSWLPPLPPPPPPEDSPPPPPPPGPPPLRGEGCSYIDPAISRPKVLA